MDTSNERFDIVVVGAGIAGLVAAVRAGEGGATVALVDAHTAGGRARTTEREGYRYNVGPHALYLAGHLRSFLAARGLEPTGGLPDTKHVRVLRDGQLWSLTMSPLDIARNSLLAPRSRVRILSLMARLAKMDTARWSGVPWADWLADEREDVAGLLRMLVRVGTYVNAPQRFDAAAALDQLKLAMRGVRYLDGGWQTMVTSLLGAFGSRGGQVYEGRTVLSVDLDIDGSPVVQTNLGELRAESVVLAGLAPDAVHRLTGVRVAGVEGSGGSVGASVLDISLARAHPGVVFGIDEPLYLSPHAPVARLAPEGAGLVSVMRYTPDDELLPMAPDAVRERLGRFAAQAGIEEANIVHERFMHHLIVANSFPTATAGGLAGRPTTDASGLPGVFLAGDWIGPRHQLADAASSSGEAAALAALRHIGSRTRVHS